MICKKKYIPLISPITKSINQYQYAKVSCYSHFIYTITIKTTFAKLVGGKSFKV